MGRQECCVCDHKCIGDKEIGLAITKYVDSDILVQYVDLFHEIIIEPSNIPIKFSPKDVICQTCAVLIKELHRFQCEIKSIEQILLQQVCRTHDVFVPGCLPLSNNKLFDDFEINLQNQFQCKNCAFSTGYIDSVAAHRKYHAIEFDEKLRIEANRNIPKSVIFEDLADDDVGSNNKANLLDFVAPLIPAPVKTYSRKKSKFSNSILSVNKDYTEDLSNIDCQETVSGTKNCIKNSNGQISSRDNQLTKNCLNCGEMTRIIDVCDHKTARMRENTETCCDQCDETFYGDHFFYRHMEQIHSFCMACGKTYNSPKILKIHKKESHPKLRFACTKCPKTLTTYMGLKYHMEQHAGCVNFKCEHCGRGFIRRNQYKEHLSKHTKVPLYVCDICGQSFIHGRTYAMHKLWHKNPQPYACKLCHVRFTTQSSVSVHMRRKHTGEKPHKCSYCNEAFLLKGWLTEHIAKMHTGIFPFNCEECARGFTKKRDYAIHLSKIHSDDTLLNTVPGERQYKVVIRPLP